MSTRVAVLGATGVYGRHLIPRLISAGYRVRALVRNPASAVVAQQCGAETVAADIFDEASLRAGLGNCDVAMNLATSLPSPTSRTGDFAANDRLRREGVPIFLRACQAAGVHKVLQQSIAMTHAGSGDHYWRLVTRVACYANTEQRRRHQLSGALGVGYLGVVDRYDVVSTMFLEQIFGAVTLRRIVDVYG